MSIRSRARSFVSKAKSAVKSVASKVVSGAKKVASVITQNKSASLASAISGTKQTVKTLSAKTSQPRPNDLLSSGLKSGGLKVISTGGRGGLYDTRSGGSSKGSTLSSSALSSSGLSYNSYGGPSQTPSTKTIGSGGRSSSGLSAFSGGSTPSFTFGGDSTGNNLSISSNSVSAAPSVSVPSAPTYANVSPVNLAGTATGNQVLDPETGLIGENTDQVEEKKQKGLDEKIAEALDLFPDQKESVYDDREVKRQQAEVRARQQEVNNYTAQLNNIVAKQNADLLNLRGIGAEEGVTETVYGGQAATINREAAIKALPIQAQIAAAQGNLDLAQDYLDELIQIKGDQIDADFEYNMAKFKIVREIMTDDEKRQLDKMELDEKRAYDQAQKNKDDVQSWMKYALENGETYVAGRIGKLINEVGSPNFEEKLGQIVAGIQDKDAGGEESSTTGSDLSDAYSAIAAGADPITVKRAFLADHPTASGAWENYFTNAKDEIEYPKPEDVEGEKTGLFGWGFLGL